MSLQNDENKQQSNDDVELDIEKLCGGGGLEGVCGLYMPTLCERYQLTRERVDELVAQYCSIVHESAPSCLEMLNSDTYARRLSTGCALM